jgi:hypothetical protein
MLSLREALLQEHLRTSRLGTPIRASLTPTVYDTIVALKEDTQRTYRDIFLIVLNVFKHHPTFFPVDREKKKSRQDVFFRLSKTDSMTALVWAWKRNQRRSNFIGDLLEQFLNLVPLTVFQETLTQRTDQAFRLKEELKKHERTGKRNCTTNS